MATAQFTLGDSCRLLDRILVVISELELRQPAELPVSTATPLSEMFVARGPILSSSSNDIEDAYLQIAFEEDGNIIYAGPKHPIELDATDADIAALAAAAFTTALDDSEALAKRFAGCVIKSSSDTALQNN